MDFDWEKLIQFLKGVRWHWTHLPLIAMAAIMLLMVIDKLLEVVLAFGVGFIYYIVAQRRPADMVRRRDVATMLVLAVILLSIAYLLTLSIAAAAVGILGVVLVQYMLLHRETHLETI